MNELVPAQAPCSYVDVGRNGEIITDSVLTRYDWPQQDPRSVAMAERRQNPC